LHSYPIPSPGVIASERRAAVSDAVTQADDAELVRRAQAGDAAGFGQLYERYFEKVYSYLSFKLGNPSEAEDLTGQVFLKALESLGSYKWTGVPFQAWLFRIAHNQLVDALRRRSRRPSAPIEHAAGVADERREASPEETLAVALQRDDVIAAVEQLTELQRQVIALKFAGGLSNMEVARLMGKSEGAVKALQHAALVSLQKKIGREALP
jgi:RNA polymerase sigma-70 factor, ECF subfamily